MQARAFPEAPAFAGQLKTTQLSAFFAPEFAWRSTDRQHQFVLSGFLRADDQDDRRTHADIREAYWQWAAANWELLIGGNRVFWGVTESRHLINVINQIDAVENIDEEDFLGQPMVQVAKQTRIGRFELFLLPFFRERPAPGRPGRLRPQIPLDTQEAIYLGAANRWYPSFAVRYTHFFGDLDIGLHIFHGVGREPALVLAAQGQTLLPVYQRITQGGIDLQYTADAWLVKFEGLVRAGQGRRFAAFVAGVEYTLFQIFQTDADLGLLVEGLYDGRAAQVVFDRLPPGAAAARGQVFPTLFDQDLFLGARLALNDTQDTSFLAGLLIDFADGPATFRLEAERRLAQSWKVQLEVQIFLETDPQRADAVFRRDHMISLQLARFF